MFLRAHNRGERPVHVLHALVVAIVYQLCLVRIVPRHLPKPKKDFLPALLGHRLAD